MACRIAPPRALVPSFAALALLAGCPGSSAEGGDEDPGETGSEVDPNEACVDPGTPLIDGAKPVGEASQTGNPQFSCVSGWGSDAPWREPAWTIRLPELMSDGFFQAPQVVAHPDGGALTYGTGTLSHYGADGSMLWSEEVGSVETEMHLALEDGGTFLLSIFDWQNDSVSLTRHASDGSELELIDVPFNEALNARIWAVETSGSNIVLGVYDTDSEGQYEETLLVLDADGNELLRRSTSLFGGIGLSTNDSGTAMFGQNPGFMVSLDDGAVLGQLTPSLGAPFRVVGGAEDFYAALNAGGDFGVGVYSSVGGEQWLQAYDRAGLGDVARGVDVRDGLIVAVGSTTSLNFINTFWFNSQPMVMATDLDGNALWTDRAAAFGEASSVAIGADGSVYVSGVAEEDALPNSEPALLRWLRKYEGA